MTSGGAADARARRCLVLADCKPALQAIEGAWRRGRVESGRGGDRGAMLEEICRLRARLGRVVFLWVPSHRGISPNSMADAAAKAYLEQPVDSAGVARIAEAVRTRPCLYAARQAEGDAPLLRDRRVYAEAYARVKEWACAVLRKDLKSGIVMGLEGRLWVSVVERVGKGVVLESDGERTGARAAPVDEGSAAAPQTARPLDNAPLVAAPHASVQLAAASVGPGGGAGPSGTGAARAAEAQLAGVLALEVGEADKGLGAFVHEIARSPRLAEDERGVGTALLLAGLTAARARHGRVPGVVQLLVDVANTEAIAWYRRRGFRRITRYTRADGVVEKSEVPGAVAVYEPKWRHGGRRGGPAQPEQFCMQADGVALLRQLQASREAKWACRTETIEEGRAAELRGPSL